jgi:N-ethylmaleimide reductase
MKVAILDDYQNVALKLADWSAVRRRAEISVFNDHVADTAAVVERLRPFDVVCVMRERTSLTREILQQLPQLKLIASTGPRDGVELHGANGYLSDQFLEDGTDKPTDEYGGPIENRARFMLELVEALVSVWGGNRVAVRLSPSGQYDSMSDSNPAATFGYLVKQLNRFGLAYLHIIEPRIKGNEEIQEDAAPVAAQHLRPIYEGTIIAAGGFDRQKALDILEAGHADLVAFGRAFIANPDLPERLRRNLPLTAYDRDTFYGGGAEGYVDYPFHDQSAVASAA